MTCAKSRALRTASRSYSAGQQYSFSHTLSQHNMDRNQKTVRPNGLWESPISVELLSSSSISLHEVVVNVSLLYAGIVLEARY